MGRLRATLPPTVAIVRTIEGGAPLAVAVGTATGIGRTGVGMGRPLRVASPIEAFGALGTTLRGPAIGFGASVEAGRVQGVVPVVTAGVQASRTGSASSAVRARRVRKAFAGSRVEGAVIGSGTAAGVGKDGGTIAVASGPHVVRAVLVAFDVGGGRRS